MKDGGPDTRTVRDQDLSFLHTSSLFTTHHSEPIHPSTHGYLCVSVLERPKVVIDQGTSTWTGRTSGPNRRGGEPSWFNLGVSIRIRQVQIQDTSNVPGVSMTPNLCPSLPIEETQRRETPHVFILRPKRLELSTPVRPLYLYTSPTQTSG